MNDEMKIRDAALRAQMLRPYVSQPALVAAATPPGGEWTCRVDWGSGGKSVRVIEWRGGRVATVDPRHQFDPAGEIAMAFRSLPVLDYGLRAIMALAESPDNLALIRQLAESVIAYVEAPAPQFPREESDDDERDGED